MFLKRMQHECIMQQTSVRVQNWRWYHSWSFPLFFLANSLLSILLTSLMRNKTRSHKNDIPVFNGSVISSSVSLIPVCGSSLSLCWNSFQLNCGVFFGGGMVWATEEVHRHRYSQMAFKRTQCLYAFPFPPVGSQRAEKSSSCSLWGLCRSLHSFFWLNTLIWASNVSGLDI